MLIRLSATTPKPTQRSMPLVGDLVVVYDLLLRFLDLHQLAELVGFARLALADHFGARFKETEQLPLGVRVPAQDARPGLAEHLLDARHERVQVLPQPLERGLLDHVGGTFDAGTNLLRKSLGLSDDATGGREQP